MTLYKKLSAIIQHLDIENQKILNELKKVTDHQNGPHLTKENLQRLQSLVQELINQTIQIQTLKSEIHQQLLSLNSMKE